MIISHEYKFIFIKTVKTAGTSIYHYLAPLCGPDDILSPIEHRLPLSERQQIEEAFSFEIDLLGYRFKDGSRR